MQTEPSLAAEVYGVLRRRILRGDLAIGTAISRRKVAADLSTSLPPVVEAFLRLEHEGLLEHRPRSGTRVRIPSPDDVKGQAVVRQALEVQAAVRFTQRATARDRDELRRQAARLDGLSGQPDRYLYAGNHLKFHLRIAEGADCPALCEAIATTCALASIWLAAARRRPFCSSTSHQELAEALAAGDAAVAADAMRRHITSGVSRWLEELP